VTPINRPASRVAAELAVLLADLRAAVAALAGPRDAILAHLREHLDAGGRRSALGPLHDELGDRSRANCSSSTISR
jgi:hypothetical protein